MLKIVSITVVMVLGVLGYSLLWSYSFALLNEPSTFLVMLGVLLGGVLIGITIWFVVKLVKRFEQYLEKEW